MRKQLSISRALEDLRSKDPETLIRATGFLGRKPRAVGALISLMDDPDARIRCSAALALGKQRAGYAVLTERMTNDSSSHVRFVCAAALRWGYPPAVEAFIDALHDDDDRVVVTACTELGDTGGEAAIMPLRHLLDHRSWKVRWSACQALYRLQAIDQQLLSTVEDLHGQPEAEEHNDSVDGMRRALDESEEQSPKDTVGTLTTGELLQATRQALVGQQGDS